MAQKGSKTPRFRRRDPAWNRRNNSDNISGILNCQKCYCEDLQTLYKRKSSLKEQESLPGLETSWTSRKKPEKTNKSCACHFHSEAEDLYRKYFNISKEKYDDLSKRTFTVEAEAVEAEEPEEVNLESNTTAEILYKQNSSKFLKSSLTNLDVESVETLEKIRNFREENYTETHGDTEVEPEPHKCIFRFSLDDRLAPVAQNLNEYGLNSCLICHKPYTKEGPREVGPLEMLSKVYDHQLTPKEINLGVDANIEMRLTERDVQLFNDCFKTKTQRPVYKNSLALRQQKMLGSVIPVGLN